MNGNFWGHLIRAAGYAVVGGAEEADQGDQPDTGRRTARRTGYAGANISTKGKKCCTAKREPAAGSGEKAASAPVATAPGASFGTVPFVRRRGGA